MKLNKVLALAGLALVLAMPAMAAPAVVTGDVTAGWISNFGTNAGYTGGFDIIVNATIDDFNSASITIARSLQTYVGSLTATATTSTEEAILSAASLTSNLGKFLKVDAKTLTWSVTAGYTRAGDNSYVSQTAYGSEDVGAATTATTWMTSTTLGIAGLINVKIGLAPLTLTSALAQDLIVGVYMAPALGTMGKINAEVFYDANANAGTSTGIGGGTLVADARFDLTAVKDLTIGIGAGMNYLLTGSHMHIGASVKGTYGTLGNLAAGFLASTLAGDPTLLVISAAISPMAPFNLLLGAKFDLTTGAASVFHSADIAVRLDIGATDLYIGYLIGNGTAGSTQTVLWAPAALGTGGGLYMKATVSF
jgi:hypothetical protein